MIVEWIENNYKIYENLLEMIIKGKRPKKN